LGPNVFSLFCCKELHITEDQFSARRKKCSQTRKYWKKKREKEKDEREKKR